MSRRLHVPALLLLSASIVTVYLWRLASAPIYLAHDEVLFAVQEHTLGTTLHDTNGRFLPLYIYNVYWTAPLHIYLGALLLRFAHVSEGVIRLPSVLAGLSAIWLMYFLGARLFRSRWYGMLAAALLALTPAEFLASRFKVESHFPVPFVVGWLLCVLLYEDTRRTRWLAAAGATLGLGVYSYHAAPMMMPVYVGLTLWLLWTRGELRSGRAVAAVALIASFCLIAAPYAMFVATHPEYLRGEAAAYQVYDAAQSSASGVTQLFSWAALRARLVVYYEYFNPSLLFFSGGSAVEETTQTAGVFLMPLALLLPAGVYRIVRHEPRSAALYLLGFLTGPLAASIVLDGGATRRILFMLPFAALIAVYGVRQLLGSGARWVRVCGVLAVLAVPVCFWPFYADYLGDYRTRSAVWFERDIRGALEAAIDAATASAAAGRDHEPPPVFISASMNSYIRWYWRFYLLKRDRPELSARTTFFNSRTATPDLFPDNAIVVAEADARDRLAASAGGLTELAHTREPEGPVSFYVWSKSPSPRREQ